MSNLDKNINPLIFDLSQLIEQSRQRVAIAINSEITMLYWNIGRHIYQFTNGRTKYGKEILQTLSAILGLSYFVKTKF